MNFSAAIFDLDGTLVESSDALADKLASMTYEEAFAEMEKLGVKDSFSEIIKEFNELAVNEYRYNVFLKDYADEYLTYLKGQGIKTALATASPRELYEPVLRHNHVYGCFDAFCTTDEAGRSKDHPDIYLLAASKLGVSPNECVVFEDVLKGIVSAKNAGMTAVGVYDKFSAEDIVTIRNTADKFIMNFSEMMK